MRNLRAALLAGLSVASLSIIQPAHSWSGNSWNGNSWNGNSWGGNSWGGNSWRRNSWNNDFYQPYRRYTPPADIDRDEPRKPKKKADTAGEKKAAQQAAALPSGPLHIIVSIEKQRATLYADGKAVTSAPVSTGTATHPTPTGVFTVLQKNKHHVSNLYDAAMPYMQRITWSGVALHTGPLPGYAASHGCVRLPNEFAQVLWKATKIGARVVIARPEVAPVEIEHANLFVRRARMAQTTLMKVAEVQQAVAQGEPAVTASVVTTRLADGAKLVPGAIMGDTVQPAGSIGMLHRPAEDTAKTAADETSPPAMDITTSIQIIKDDVKSAEPVKAPEAAKPAVVATPALSKPAIEERASAAEIMPTAKATKPVPISVFVSRKEAKLYVRQGMEPVFDTPVVIKDADKPVGTHVFTAMNLKDDGASMRWTVVSIPSGYARDTAKAEKTPHGKPAKHAIEHVHQPSAKEALDRLDIAPDTLARIETMMAPGSSLIVSDNKLSEETGKGTDFVILTR